MSDENFDGDMLRGLLRRLPELDLLLARDAGLGGTPDPAILAWAAAEQRILLTHDRQTIPGFAFARVDAATNARRLLSATSIIDSRDAHKLSLIAWEETTTRGIISMWAVDVAPDRARRGRIA